MDLAAAVRLASTLVMQWEGCKLDAYLDTIAKPPVWTIAHGLTEIDGKPVCEGMTCTQQQANGWTAKRLVDAALCVQRQCAVPLSEPQLGALTSFCYNIGNGKFARSDVLSALNHGLYQVAADRLLEWDHAGGKQVRGLTSRRAAERAMFLQTAISKDGITRSTIGSIAATSSADDLNQAEIDKIHHTGTIA
jgi:lysozyme